ELYATEGLNREAVHLAQLKIGQGLVGTIAASAQPLKLPKQRNQSRRAGPHLLNLKGQAEEGMVDFLDRFRQVAEGRVRLSVGKVERL
ncbi:hypothetical protein ACC743_38650, partial [Rhizobium ruizarguesonis]